MRDDDLDDDDLDDDDEDDTEDLPVFSLEEVDDPVADEAGSATDIFIEEKAILKLGDIVTFANKSGKAINIENCVVKEANLHAVKVAVGVDEASFETGLRSKNGSFGGRLRFMEVDFEEEAELSGAVFQEDVVFDECVFANRVDFSQGVFKKNAYFTSCQFQGDVLFDHARFAGNLISKESVFEKRASFLGTRFEKSVDLINTIFKQAPETSGSNLEEAQRQGPAHQPAPERPHHKKRKNKEAFNPWRKLDGASKKTMTRRHLLRGLFRFLPDEDEE